MGEVEEFSLYSGPRVKADKTRILGEVLRGLSLWQPKSCVFHLQGQASDCEKNVVVVVVVVGVLSQSF